MLKKIFAELKEIRKELQSIKKRLESMPEVKLFRVPYTSEVCALVKMPCKDEYVFMKPCKDEYVPMYQHDTIQ